MDTSNMFEENVVFRLGSRVQAEAERRGLDTLRSSMPVGFDWPFRSWEAFKRFSDEHTSMPDWMRAVTRRKQSGE
jgi:hypothetical protein